MAEDRKKVSTEQLSILIEELERDPLLLSARSRHNVKLQYAERWEILAKRLNSVENGAIKNVTKWQQSWRDWKSNTKKKVKMVKDKNILYELNSQELSSLERRVLNLSDADPLDVQTEGIDISNIAEIDHLASSNDIGDDHQNNETKVHYRPDIITVYTAEVTNGENRNKKRQIEDDTVRIKRKRIRMVLNDIASRQTEILSRITALETARREADERHIKSVERMTAALEDQANATSRQADAIEAQTQLISRVVEILQTAFQGREK